jgi:hypothetical protein
MQVGSPLLCGVYVLLKIGAGLRRGWRLVWCGFASIMDRL